VALYSGIRACCRLGCIFLDQISIIMHAFSVHDYVINVNNLRVHYHYAIEPLISFSYVSLQRISNMHPMHRTTHIERTIHFLIHVLGCHRQRSLKQF
jgi:hypothetical protein